MMKRSCFIFFLFIFVAFLSLYAEENKNNKEDPFDSLLPQKPGGQTMAQKPPMPPAVTIEGVLWDSDTPQAIIDGEVYKVGNNLKNLDATIYKIEKNSVFIFYDGRLYEMKVAKKVK